MDPKASVLFIHYAKAPRKSTSTATNLHDAVPVVASGHSEEGQERDAEVPEVGVFAEPFARVNVGAL